MKFSRWIAAFILIIAVIGLAVALGSWKARSWEKAAADAALMPEPMEMVKAAVAQELSFSRSTIVTGTVRALQSITLQNEMDGTVEKTKLISGAIVEAGEVLVALDIRVEQSELKACAARAELARLNLERIKPLSSGKSVAASDVDKALAEHDMALAEVERIRATMDRKTLRAPFRARIGMADLHQGQYLEAGTILTTLQGIDPAVHVDFQVPQDVAITLKPGAKIEILAAPSAQNFSAEIVALDALTDAATRNLTVRARIDGTGSDTPSPGSAVRVRVPVGGPSTAVAIPVTALRRGAEGDFVYALTKDNKGQERASVRLVKVATLEGENVFLADGLQVGERIATSGSFKLREGALVMEAPAADKH